MRRMRPGTNEGTSDDDDDDDAGSDSDAESDADSEDENRGGGFEPTTPATPATPPLPASTPPPSVLAARSAPSSSSSSSRLRRRRRRRGGGLHPKPTPTDGDVSDREDEEATRAAVMSGFDTFWHGFELEPKISLAGETTALEDASSPSSAPSPSSPTREIHVPSPANPGEPGEDSDSNSNDARYLSSSAPSRSPASTAPHPAGRHPVRDGFGTARAPGHGRHLSLELNKPPPRFAGISRVMDLTSFESDAEHRADDDDTAGGGDGDEGGGTVTPSMSDGSRSPKSPKPKIPAFFRSRRRAARTSEGIESDDTTDDSEEDVAGLYSPLRLSKTTASTATTEAADGGGWELSLIHI